MYVRTLTLFYCDRFLRNVLRFAVSTAWERKVAEGNPPKDIHSYFCCCARRIGHMFALVSYPDGTPIVVAGPCWPFCVGVTLPLILVVTGLVSYFLVVDGDFGLVSSGIVIFPVFYVVVFSSLFLTSAKLNLLTTPQPSWILYIYFPAVGFVLVALACVSCRDPGLMERVVDEEAGEGGWFWNEQVGSFRPPGALYCRECGVLIQDYDHL
jgi:hypothetical protein